MNPIQQLLPIREHFPHSIETNMYEVTDVGYREYQKRHVQNITEMNDWLEAHYGPLAKLAVLIKNYVCQVNNGGHAQYFDNGYASKHSEGCMVKHEEIEAHNELIKLVKEHLNIPLQDELLKILEMFDITEDTECVYCCGMGTIDVECSDCEGHGEIEVEEDEWENCTACGGNGSLEEDCDNCGGTGEDKGELVVNDDTILDNLLYAIGDDLIAQIEKFYDDIFAGATV